MAKSRISYLNGLAIVCIVFISLSVVPVGVLAGVAFSEGGYNSHEFDVAPESNYTLFLDIKGDLVFYYDIYDYPHTNEFEIAIVSDTSYYDWNASADPKPAPELVVIGDEDHFRWIRAFGEDKYFIIYNDDNETTLQVEFYYFTADRAQIIGGLAVGLVFSTFTAILALHTAFYILRVLIFIPIFGFRYSNGDDRRKGRSYNYDYRAAPRAPAAPATPAVKAAPATPAAPAAPAVPSIRSTPVVPVRRGPAIQNISKTYVVAGQAKQYPDSDFKRVVMKTWDATSIAERVLVVIALFFLLTGAVTTTWYILVVFPLTLIGIAIIVYFAGRNRREKLIRLVESNKAVYITEAARILRSASEIIRMDAWKIINLGLAPIGFDTQNHILFDISQIDPSKIQDVSPEAQKIHDELVSEVAEKVDVKEEKKVEEVVIEGVEVKCPFCDSNNPPDSSFCIKCGASLKPAK